jgi:hypothetical protein
VIELASNFRTTLLNNCRVPYKNLKNLRKRLLQGRLRDVRP